MQYHPERIATMLLGRVQQNSSIAIIRLHSFVRYPFGLGTEVRSQHAFPAPDERTQCLRLIELGTPSVKNAILRATFQCARPPFLQQPTRVAHVPQLWYEYSALELPPSQGPAMIGSTSG